MSKKILLAGFLLTPLIASAAMKLPSTPYLPLNLATEAAQAAISACAVKGYAVSVAIVARDGSTKVLLKADNSAPITESSATGKAFTSAAMGRDTAGLATFIAANPDNAGLRDLDSRMVVQAGGLPIKFGDSLVAGIGVGGAPGGDLDTECAAAGLEKIGAERFKE